VSGPEMWWRPHEVAFLEEHYPQRGPAVGVDLGRTKKAAMVKANRLGVNMKRTLSEASYMRKLRRAGITI
jgi:hypothetical protein